MPGRLNLELRFAGLYLLDLLTVYGQEFENAIVAEDGESAIMYVGDMGYFECEYSCNQLPGHWTLPRGVDLVPVYSDLHVSPSTYTWIDKRYQENAWSIFPYYVGHSTESYREVEETNKPGIIRRCYCTAKQLPRVEYGFCLAGALNTSALNAFQSCVDEKLQNGWYPLDGPSKGYPSDFIQAFWRFAQ